MMALEKEKMRCLLDAVIDTRGRGDREAEPTSEPVHGLTPTPALNPKPQKKGMSI